LNFSIRGRIWKVVFQRLLHRVRLIIKSNSTSHHFKYTIDFFIFLDFLDSVKRLILKYLTRQYDQTTTNYIPYKIGKIILICKTFFLFCFSFNVSCYFYFYSYTQSKNISFIRLFAHYYYHRLMVYTDTSIHRYFFELMLSIIIILTNA